MEKARLSISKFVLTFSCSDKSFSSSSSCLLNSSVCSRMTWILVLCLCRLLFSSIVSFSFLLIVFSFDRNKLILDSNSLASRGSVGRVLSTLPYRSSKSLCIFRLLVTIELIIFICSIFCSRLLTSLSASWLFRTLRLFRF